VREEERGDGEEGFREEWHVFFSFSSGGLVGFLWVVEGCGSGGGGSADEVRGPLEYSCLVANEDILKLPHPGNLKKTKKDHQKNQTIINCHSRVSIRQS